MSCTHKRNNAILKWLYMLRDAKEGMTYHLGIRSQNHVFLDFEKKDVDIESYAYLLKQLLANHGFDNINIGIFETAKGYHLVAKQQIPHNVWEKIYDFLLENWKDVNGFCVLHAQLSRKYDYTTLRISPKNGNIPKLIKII